MSISLEEELELPKEASLAQTPAWMLTSTQGSISISPETSLRKEQQVSCLLVGRQSSTADIRIQHGSISRKHAVLYYDNGDLYVKDLGGKHGSHVNGTRVDGTVKLQDGDSVYFGNAQESTFTVRVPETTSLSEEPASTAVVEQEANPHPILEKAPEVGEVLTGRAKREAEIAAIMASLEDTPTYEKYKQPEAQVEEEPTLSTTSSLITQYSIPVSERFDLEHDTDDRKRVVTSLAVDPAGSRFAVGGTDTNLRLYDFAGMDQLRTGPFKTIEIEEGHPVVDVCYSHSGDRLLIATGSVQPKVLDRDGNEIIQFVRGDMYVTDMARTAGHTAAVTGVDWHPFERDVVLTGSMDGSARLWNLNGKTQFHNLVCDKVYRAKNVKGQRVGVTSVAFHPGGRELAFGTACGSLQIWNATRVGARPEKVTFHAHGEGRPLNSLAYNFDGSQIASRSAHDDTVKVWDAKRLSRSSTPVVSCGDLPTVHERSNAVFSPDGRFLCAGTSEFRKGPNNERFEDGSLKIFLVRREAGSSSHQKPGDVLSESHVGVNVGVIRVRWHAKLNQIFAGCSDGRTCVYFDRVTSTKGGLLATSRVGRPVDELSQLLLSRVPTGSAAFVGEIITPNALPMFRGVGRETKRKREKDRLDPVKSRKPEPPASGIKTGSQSGANVTFAQMVAESIVQTKNIAGKDPREELFKYQEGKEYVNKAYGGDKPNPLTVTTLEVEEEEAMKPKK